MLQSRFFPKQSLCFVLILAGALLFASCQKKSVLDAPANLAPPVRQPRPAPTQMPLKIVTPAVDTTPAAVTGEAQQAKDFELVWQDSSKIKLSQVLGQGKVVVVNFWATWCGPCRREIPELIALQKEYQGQAVEILGLSIEEPQQFQELVKAFSKQFEINYKVGFAPLPMFILFNGTDPARGIPQTFIFGKDGKLVHHIRGLRPAFKDYVRETIEEALKAA
jgi:thiol-disulfide isomerase/thioredoxin